MNRGDLFKFLAGIGLRAVAIETYERLHRIPILETMFRRELGYRINQYNTTREEVGRLNSIINKLDELERESTSAIAYYSKVSRRDALKLLGLAGGALVYLALDFYAKGPISTLISEMRRDRGKPVIRRVVFEKYGLRGSPYSVDVEATDNVDVESVLLEVVDPSGSLSYYKASKVEKDFYRISFVPSLKGRYEARAIVKDTSNNVSISESFRMISLTETEDRLRRICPNEKIFEKGYELINDLELSERKLRNESLEALKNYSISLFDLNLPYEKEGLLMLIEASEINPAIVDFEPIVIKDVKGNVINIESSSRARDTWMIAYLLKQRPELVEQPKKFEWINRMIQQVAWNIFDDEYGPSFFDKKPYHPTDKDVWDIILAFHDYMDKLPSKMEKDGLPIFFHYWDSDLLQKEIPDKTNRTFALLFLGNLPNKAYDRDTYQVVVGMDALKLFVKRLPQMYDWIVSAWKNPGSKEHEYAMVAYRMWLQDRFIHGLENTVKQFSGVWPFEQEGTIDDFLNKNFFAWRFAKFPYAYLRGRFYWSDSNIPNYGEWVMYGTELRLAYKSVGIPLGGIGGSGTSGNLGGPGNYIFGEFAIYGIPQSVIDALLAAQKSLGRVAVGYGNGVSMMSAIDGFEKDSGYEILHEIRRINIYLWKKR